jgi:hypothetical protein
MEQPSRPMTMPSWHRSPRPTGRSPPTAPCWPMPSTRQPPSRRACHRDRTPRNEPPSSRSMVLRFPARPRPMPTLAMTRRSALPRSCAVSRPLRTSGARTVRPPSALSGAGLAPGGQWPGFDIGPDRRPLPAGTPAGAPSGTLAFVYRRDRAGGGEGAWWDCTLTPAPTRPNASPSPQRLLADWATSGTAGAAPDKHL